MRQELLKIALWSVGVLLWSPGASWGQARSSYQWNSPGGSTGFRELGGNFTRYSYGLGGTAHTWQDGGVLGSSIGRQYDPSIRSSLSGATASPLSPFGATGGLKPAAYGSTDFRLPKPDLQAVSRLPQVSGPSYNSLAQTVESYLLTLADQAATQPADKPVQSFVPPEPSEFQRHMQRADSAFRNGRFNEAHSGLAVAAALAGSAPECSLSLTLSSVALGHYYQASMHLREALKGFPELPLVNVDLPGFYGDRADFDRHLRQLQQQVELAPADLDAALVLAYVQYFSGDRPSAVAGVRRLHALAGESNSAVMLEACEIFYDGMMAAGAAAEPLPPASRPARAPATASAPSAPSTTPATNPSPAAAVSDTGPAAQKADTKGLKEAALPAR